MNKLEESFIFFYMEQSWEEMRHIENLRERVSILVITLASAVAGFIMQQKFSTESKLLIPLIIFLGLFGYFMSLKLFQIHQLGQKRLNKWYEYLEKNCGENPQILQLKKIADDETRKSFSQVSKIPHNYFWSTIYGFIILGGICLAFVKPQKDVESKSKSEITVIIKNETRIDTLKTNNDTITIKNHK